MNRNKTLSLYLAVILFGIISIILTYLLLTVSSPLYNWLIGLGSAIIIIGLCYLLNYLTVYWKFNRNELLRQPPDNKLTYAKEKAGYLVCKIINILLCVYLLILNALQVEPLVLLLSIGLVMIQYILNLLLQIYYMSK